MSNVYTNKTPAGAIGRIGDYSRFDYADTVSDNETIALSMPPLPAKRYDGTKPGALLPVFAMNIPEGRLRESLVNKFEKLIPRMDDMALLEIVGRSQIGRIRVASSAAELDIVPALSLTSLLATDGTEKALDEMLERHARYSGIAGVQPKILIRDEALEKISPDKKATVSGTTHIVKFFESATYPALAANEYACLTAARAAGLAVPAFQLANDAQCLALERFDTNPDGTYAAVEDTCSLAGLQPGDKYTGSYEQVAKTLTAAIAPAHRKQDMAAFFRTLVLSIIVRNGDAHRKNFSVLYNTPADVRLSPAYDIISTTPYLPNDTIALTLNGSKRWPGRKQLIQFALNSCNIEPRQAGEIIDQVRDAVSQTKDLLVAMCKTRGKTIPGFALVATINAWEDGLWQTRELSNG
jgi:serine/threonine-protein kinase HipA